MRSVDLIFLGVFVNEAVIRKCINNFPVINFPIIHLTWNEVETTLVETCMYKGIYVQYYILYTCVSTYYRIRSFVHAVHVHNNERKRVMLVSTSNKRLLECESMGQA